MRPVSAGVRGRELVAVRAPPASQCLRPRMRCRAAPRAGGPSGRRAFWALEASGLRWRCGRGRGPQRPLSSPCPAPCGGLPALRPREHACGLLPARTAGLLATPALETLGERWPLDPDLRTHSPWDWGPARSSWGHSSAHNEGHVHFSWERPAGFLFILFFLLQL